MMKLIARSLASIFVLAFMIALATSFAPAKAQDASITAAGATIMPDRLIVRYKSGADVMIGAASATLDAVQVVDSLEGMQTQILQVPPDRLHEVYTRLRQDPNVESVAYDVMTVPAATPNDPYLADGKQWAPQRLQAPEAWDFTSGQEVIMAIVDSGVDPNHPDLRDRLIPGYNIYDNNTNTSDVCGHGTHLAGIAAATGNNALGISGIAYSARIMPVKVMASNCTGSYSRMIQGIVYAVDNGARVIVISSGATVDSSYLRDALIYARDRGVVVAAAAGNYNSQEPFYPAAYPEAICVAGTDANDARYAASNYGSHVDVAAPGSGIYSTVWTSSGGSTYAYMSGTSMAAPHVGGVAALLLARNPNLSVGEIESILSASADDLGTPGWDPYFGAGRINALRAVMAAGAAIPTPTATPTETAPVPTPTATPAPTETPMPTVEPPTPEPTESVPTPVPPTPTVELPAPTVVPPLPSPTAQPSTIHVEDLTIRTVRRWPRWLALATVTVADSNGQPAGGALVQATWGGAYVAPAACTTNAAGTCSFSSIYLRQKSGTLTLAVDNVLHPTQPYDPAANQVALPMTGIMPQSSATVASLTAQPTDNAVLLNWSLSAVDASQGLALFRATSENPEDAQLQEIAPSASQNWEANTSYAHTDTAVAPDATYTYWLVQIEDGAPADELAQVSVSMYVSGVGGPVSRIYVPLISQ